MKVDYQNVSQVQCAVRDAHHSLRYIHKCSNEQLLIAAQSHSATQAHYFLLSTIHHYGRWNLAAGRSTSATLGHLVWLPYIFL
jgi:hypothetical protein